MIFFFFMVRSAFSNLRSSSCFVILILTAVSRDALFLLRDSLKIRFISWRLSLRHDLTVDISGGILSLSLEVDLILKCLLKRMERGVV